MKMLISQLFPCLVTCFSCSTSFSCSLLRSWKLYCALLWGKETLLLTGIICVLYIVENQLVFRQRTPTGHLQLHKAPWLIGFTERHGKHGCREHNVWMNKDIPTVFRGVADPVFSTLCRNTGEPSHLYLLPGTWQRLLYWQYQANFRIFDNFGKSLLCYSLRWKWLPVADLTLTSSVQLGKWENHMKSPGLHHTSNSETEESGYCWALLLINCLIKKTKTKQH